MLEGFINLKHFYFLINLYKIMGYQTEIYGKITCNHKEVEFNKNIINQYENYPYYKENFTFIKHSYSFALILFGASIKINESEVIDSKWKK